MILINEVLSGDVNGQESDVGLSFDFDDFLKSKQLEGRNIKRDQPVEIAIPDTE